MRTNIVLDDALVADAMRLGGLATKREAVEVALREYVARKRSRRVLKLATAGLIDPDYDVRAVRRAMRRGPG
ncbi:MAG: type II toxin-antitoxin system VapB family antitoxin [Burkholderiales bacterium]|nr:type II toxin-antitoxin system VapB family antitoxin [Burkholderiales bacterium]